MENQIVIGIRLTDKIQEQLNECIPAYQYYFKDGNPEYLQIIRVNGERVLGKTLQPGITVETIENYAANIKSIFHKICPGHRVGDSDVRIFAQTLIG